jgi:hypothetical protein
MPMRTEELLREIALANHENHSPHNELCMMYGGGLVVVRVVEMEQTRRGISSSPQLLLLYLSMCAVRVRIKVLL